MTPEETLYAILMFVFGLAFGSFLNVAIYRLPRQLSAVRPRSACPHCHTPIRAYDNIPVVSWLALRGRCRACKQLISPRYVIVELLTASLFLGCYLRFGLTVATLKYCLFAFLLLGLIFIDAEWKLLPDAFTLRGLVAGLLFSLFVPVDGFAVQVLPEAVALPLSSNASWRLMSLADSMAGAIVGALMVWGAGALYLAARGIEGMGFGDVKLMAMIGAFLGVKLTVLTLFLASVAGSLAGISAIFLVWRKRMRRRMRTGREPAALARRRAWQSATLVYRRYEMPFGVFLGAVALFSVFFGRPLIDWYFGFYA